MNTKYDWANAPSEVKWIATDADGVIGGYSEKPYRNKGALWMCNDEKPNSWVCNIHPFTYYEKNDCPNWQDSLEERPK